MGDLDQRRSSESLQKSRAQRGVQTIRVVFQEALPLLRRALKLYEQELPGELASPGEAVHRRVQRHRALELAESALDRARVGRTKDFRTL